MNQERGEVVHQFTRFPSPRLYCDNCGATWGDYPALMEEVTVYANGDQHVRLLCPNGCRVGGSGHWILAKHPKDSKSCPYCKRAGISPRAPFCPQCGEPLEESDNRQKT